MFGFGSTSKAQSSDSPEPTRIPPPSQPTPVAAPPRRTFERLVEEELPIQRHSVEMEGGMPSCLTLFDNFLLCYSLASQAKSVYRHGQPRDCSPKFEDFKFCMSLKGVSEERKDEIWVERRSRWWAERRMGRSSEDVWEARTDVYEDPKQTKRDEQRTTQ